MPTTKERARPGAKPNPNRLVVKKAVTVKLSTWLLDYLRLIDSYGVLIEEAMIDALDLQEIKQAAESGKLKAADLARHAKKSGLPLK